jgi:hypothetical protein
MSTSTIEPIEMKNEGVEPVVKEKVKRVYKKRPKEVISDAPVIEMERMTIQQEPATPMEAPVKQKRPASCFALYYKDQFKNYEGSAAQRMKIISANYRKEKEAKLTEAK